MWSIETSYRLQILDGVIPSSRSFAANLDELLLLLVGPVDIGKNGFCRMGMPPLALHMFGASRMMLRRSLTPPLGGMATISRSASAQCGSLAFIVRMHFQDERPGQNNARLDRHQPLPRSRRL